MKSLYNCSTFSRTIRILLGSILGPYLVGCAGPTTPFGPVELTSRFNAMLERARTSLTSTSQIDIQFEPATQFYLKPQDLRIYIRDDRGIPESAKIAVLYNGIDVSHNLNLAEDDHGHYSRALIYENLSLPASALNEIEIVYLRDPASQEGTVARLPRPNCDWVDRKPLESLGDFRTSPEVIRVIEEAAFDHSFNPAFLAALVAQESGFNPRAVSTYKAIGLTQMTHMAETDILDRAKQWPRYPGIQNLSYLELKYKILTRSIHDENEWRLNPALSIMGGSLYLQHLQDYWFQPKKMALASQSGSDISDIILASYNIGPSAVSRSIQRGGVDWLKDREGRRAVKYVNMVESYCEFFSKGDT